MTDTTLRSTKGSPLTHIELDNNQISTKAGRHNLVIGGNFDTNPFGRGESFTAPVNPDYIADRFSYRLSGTAVVNSAKTADAPSVAQAGFNVTNCLQLDVTTLDSSILSSHFYHVSTHMEGYDWAQIAQNDFVVSFWHKHTKAGIYCIALRNESEDRSYVSEYTQSVTDTWEKATIKVSASPSAGGWNYTTGIGIELSFAIAVGSNFHGAADTWNSANDLSTVNQVNAMDSTSNFFRIALVQIEEGVEGTDFERRSIVDETALCERYYEKSYLLGIAPTTVTADGIFAMIAVGTTYDGYIAFNAIKRVTPTVTFGSPTDATHLGRWRDTTSSNDRALSRQHNGTRGMDFRFTASVDGNKMEGHWTADAEF